jgi:thioredoxin-related protein
MNFRIIPLLLLLALPTAQALAGAYQEIEEAKARASQNGKTILLEFIRDDCEYCQLAASEAETDQEVQNALNWVEYVSINVLQGDGIKLKEDYKVGITYPVFILVDSNGDVITRWTGYSDGAGFVITLDGALKDTRTIKKRIADFESEPNAREAAKLARFFESIGGHLRAVEFFARAEGLQENLDFSYEKFSNIANAVWKEQAGYESIFPAADAAINSSRDNKTNDANVGRLMARLARKFERTDSLEKYLNYGIDRTTDDQSPKLKQLHNLLRSELALQIQNDTARAVAIKKEDMGPGWDDNRDVAFGFAKWCLERKINLEEAESIARATVDQVYPGVYRARVLSTLAEIQYARGMSSKAVSTILLAIEQNPDDPLYTKQLRRFHGEANE